MHLLRGGISEANRRDSKMFVYTNIFVQNNTFP